MSYNVFVPDRELIELISLLDGVNEEGELSVIITLTSTLI